MLQLLSLLQLQSFWHGPELAERLGVSERTLRRDIERLRNLGYGIDSARGADGGYEMVSGGRMAPLTFSQEEAVALAIGLRDVAHGSDPHTAEASLTALAKLNATLPPSVRDQIALMAHVTDGPGPWRSSDQPVANVLSVVAQACRDGVRLRFDYVTHGDAGSEPEQRASPREVDPYRLVQRGRRWYLFAFDVDRDDWRTFRIDRITRPVSTRHAFAVRDLPAVDVAAYVADRMRDLRPAHPVSFTVHAPVPVVAPLLRREGATVSNKAPGHSRVDMIVDDLDWAMLIVLRLNHPVSQLSENLSAHIATRRRSLSSLARKSGT
jgi:predicted DNA-binding transcriptional regulator YafY